MQLACLSRLKTTAVPTSIFSGAGAAVPLPLKLINKFIILHPPNVSSSLFVVIELGSLQDCSEIQVNSDSGLSLPAIHYRLCTRKKWDAMDHHMEVDEEDLEPTPLALPHQVVHRVVSNSPNDFVSGNHEDFLRSADQHVPKVSTKRSQADNVISDSDGAGDDGEEDDDFHSAASHDAFQISPDSMDVVFGRGQPLRDHPVRKIGAVRHRT